MDARKIVACEVFRHELGQAGIPDNLIVYVEQNFHQTPPDLNRRLFDILARLEDEGWSEIILLYGYCGGALEGLAARRARLIIPKAHDCIPLFLGQTQPADSPERLDTYYLSGGWVDFAGNPYKEYLALAEKVDEEEARWAVCEMMKAYKKLVFIENEMCPAERYRNEARRFADFFGLSYSEMGGNLAWLTRLLAGEPGADVLVFEPGRKVAKEDFL